MTFLIDFIEKKQSFMTSADGADTIIEMSSKPLMNKTNQHIVRVIRSSAPNGIEEIMVSVVASIVVVRVR